MLAFEVVELIDSGEKITEEQMNEILNSYKRLFKEFCLASIEASELKEENLRLECELDMANDEIERLKGE